MELMEGLRSINQKLLQYREAGRRPSIFKVHHHFLSGIDDSVCEPRVVAIGPYHHGKYRLRMMEEHKLQYLNSLLLRKNESVGRYISAVREIEEEARSSYAEDCLSSDLIEMLVLDGCFIIELLRRSQLNPDPSDTVFQMKWIPELLKHDLILFENQIPFFVLCKLFDLIYDEEETNPRDLMHSFISFMELEEVYRSKGVMNMKPEEVTHLLHLTHATLIPSSDVNIDLYPHPVKTESRLLRLIPSAAELKDVGIKFRASERGRFVFDLKVDFDKNGVLSMPSLYIGDDTERFLRNLIFYEQYFPDNRATYVTDYVLMMDCLINTEKDVEILSQCGIVVNLIGDNRVAADVINRLTQFAVVTQTRFIYAHTFKQINAHHKREWNRVRAALKRDYFNTPWAYASFFAAVFFLLLTVAQTIMAAIQL